ncbi:M23 family metallopeptidase [Eubacterium pyruvativorans]|uniref:M23 family metallopeptidase n=1 Tax=Eubacterium pyruvativorans TaxID=155865 RepID=UPI000888FFA7|nr:M23 family metallopeptidase [Eubacterium pyruvativorans]SDF30426.1 Peptidase family M23 [Eubacterium pyruvativorans]
MSTFIWPVPSSKTITSGFGPRRSPGGIGSTNHDGVDIGCPVGTAVIAARSGRVVRSCWFGGYGNYVEIDHGGGVHTFYGHLSRRKVGVGQIVSAGQVIAASGNTGASTGPHLHFGMHINGQRVNPLSHVRSSDTKGSYTGGSVSRTSPAYSAAGKKTPVKKNKPITKIKVKSVSGKVGKRKPTALYTYKSVEKTGVEVLMQHGESLFEPVVKGHVTIEWTRRDSPGKMTITVLLDGKLKLSLGDAVRLRYNGKNIFLGFLFHFSQTAEGEASLTYYDQLRYFKNKDLLKLKKGTYSAALKQICKKYGLKTGTVENTRWVHPAKIVDGTIFDALGEYADMTTAHTQKLYVLYDEFGKITLKSLAKMKSNVYIDAEQLEDFEYNASIDDGTYTCIKLYKDDSSSGTRKVWVRNNTALQAKWGTLVYTEKTDEKGTKNIMTRAKILSGLYGSAQRSLTLKGCPGDISIRGGSLVYVTLKLNDTEIGKGGKKKHAGMMVVESVTHNFEGAIHTMDLKVIGGKFNA